MVGRARAPIERGVARDAFRLSGTGKFEGRGAAEAIAHYHGLLVTRLARLLKAADNETAHAFSVELAGLLPLGGGVGRTVASTAKAS
jgi:hypothetical protein